MKQVTTCKELGITPTSQVLVYMPHPDDEAVFVSGLLQKLVASKISTKAITVTHGEASNLKYGLSANADLGKARSQELQAAYQLLGIKPFDIWNFPDGQLDKQNKLFAKKLVSQFPNSNQRILLYLSLMVFMVILTILLSQK